MTVEKLIRELQKMPKDAIVVHSQSFDWRDEILIKLFEKQYVDGFDIPKDVVLIAHK